MTASLQNNAIYYRLVAEGVWYCPSLNVVLRLTDKSLLGKRVQKEHKLRCYYRGRISGGGVQTVHAGAAFLRLLVTNRPVSCSYLQRGEKKAGFVKTKEWQHSKV